jgi:hypothetical protein
MTPEPRRSRPAGTGQVTVPRRAPDVEHEQTGIVKRLIQAGLALLAFIWITFCLVSADLSLGLVETIATMAARLGGPLALLVALAIFLEIRSPSPSRGYGFHDGMDNATADAAEAAMRLGDAHARMLDQTRDYAAIADKSASTLVDSIEAISDQSRLLDQRTEATRQMLSDIGAHMTSLVDSTPHLEDRLAMLSETLSRLCNQLDQRQIGLSEQINSTAIIAEEASRQLIDSSNSLQGRVDSMRETVRLTGDELTNMAELSAARVDLTLDHVRSVLETTEQRIERQNSALSLLVEQGQEGIESFAAKSAEIVRTRCREVVEMLEKFETRFNLRADDSTQWYIGISQAIDLLGTQFEALEADAGARATRLVTAMQELAAQTVRLSDALVSGHAGSDKLIARSEDLLMSLTTGLRELDQSLPEAILRVENRLGQLRGQISETAPHIESIEVLAVGMTSQFQQNDQLVRDQIDALTTAIQGAQSTVLEQRNQVDALSRALKDASRDMERLSQSAGPNMVEALARVRDTAEVAASRAREAIGAVIPQAVAHLSQASGSAIEQAVSSTVSVQLERLSIIADNAVKAAHRATDKLNRQMIALTDVGQALEDRIAANSQLIETQDQSVLARLSSELIDRLNSRAIDVDKWLERDVSEQDWNAYLSGDRSRFTRRAARFASGQETRDINQLYQSDKDFHEHVNRYLHDFEALLKGVLTARQGSTLAMTMLSSDIGKLYIALAQAIDRIKGQ